MKDLQEVVNRVKVEQREWSLRNFGRHPAADPAIGVVEELGELAHAVLKKRQGIRGTTEEHDAAARDAVGDIAIYLLDVVNSISSRIVSPLRTPPSTVPLLFLSASVGALSMHVGQENFAAAVNVVESILNTLNTYCAQMGWNFAEILDETWDQVKKRDWKAAPTDGQSGDLQPAAEGSSAPHCEAAAMAAPPEA